MLQFQSENGSKWTIIIRREMQKRARFYLAITPEGEKTKVIFDLKKITHNTQDRNPDGVGDFNPIKLYTSKGLRDFMRSKGKTLQIFWDDFKLWKDKGVE